MDDWARKRGQTYGTILVDLEQRRVGPLTEVTKPQKWSNLWGLLQCPPSFCRALFAQSFEQAGGILWTDLAVG